MSDRVLNTLIKAPALDILGKLDALQVSDQTRDRVNVLCNMYRYSIPQIDLPKMLWHEWVNDLFALGQQSNAFTAAVEASDEAFLTWASTRVREPFTVSVRAFEQAAKMYGFDRAAEFVRIVWPQELAWAKLFRSHPDDELAVLANLFVRGTPRHVTRIFHKICAAASDALETTYFNDKIHKLTLEEIATYKVETCKHRPLFVEIARQEHASKTDRLTPQQLATLASQAREAVKLEVASSAERDRMDFVNQFPPALNILSLYKLVVRNGLSPNEISAGYSVYMDMARAGKFRSEQDFGSAAHFIDWVRSQDRALILARIGGDEEKRRQAVANLNSSFIEGLLTEMVELGGKETHNFVAWRNSVLAGDRKAPIDPKLDYYVYLMLRDD